MPAAINEVISVAALPVPAVIVVVGPSSVDLLFDQPAVTDANLVSGANYIAPRGDVAPWTTLPLSAVTIKSIPPARAELLAQLPGLTVQPLVLRPSVPLNVEAGAGANLPGIVLTGKVRYELHTQRPTAGRTSYLRQVAKQTEDGAKQDQQDAAATPAGWKTFWRRMIAAPQDIDHRLSPVLASLPMQHRMGQ